MPCHPCGLRANVLEVYTPRDSTSDSRRMSDVTTIDEGLGGAVPRPALRVLAEDSGKLARPAASHHHVGPRVTYLLPRKDRPRTHSAVSLTRVGSSWIALWLADYDPEITWIAAQPLRLAGRDGVNWCEVDAALVDGFGRNEDEDGNTPLAVWRSLERT